MPLSRKRSFPLALVSLALMLVAVSIFLFWNASRVVRDTARRIATESEIRFSTNPLDMRIPPGFEAISAPSSFTGALPWQGHLYLCGPPGLFEYDLEGTPIRRFHVGLELPAAPLIQLATANLASGTGPELLAATTGEGLLAFDGRRFRQIRPEKPEHRKLTAILPLATGRVLLGTERSGVLLYDGKQIVPFHTTLSDVAVTALAGNDASIWVGTLDHGLLHWQAGRVETFAHPDSLPDPQVLSLATFGDSLYAGTPMGVAEIRSGRYFRSLGAGFLARALHAREDRLYIGTQEEGVVQIPLVARVPRVPRPEGELLDGPIRHIFELEGVVYALSERGLFAVEGVGGGWRHLLARDGAVLAERNISALSIDRAGNLWVGYLDRGLDIVDPGADSARHLENDRLFCINRITHDRDRGRTLVATANGLVILDGSGRQMQVMGRAEGLIADHVTDVSLGPTGMTVATPAGLTFIEPAAIRSIYAFHGLVNNHAYTLATFGDRLLVGTLGGLSVLDAGVITATYTAVNSGLRHNWVTAIAPVGPEWFIGTYGGGITRLDGSGRCHSFPDLDPRLEINPNAMVVTERRVYAGTLRQGLLVYDRDVMRWSAITRGLPSANVTALAADSGYLYAGTDNGLVRIRQQTFPEH